MKMSFSDFYFEMFATNNVFEKKKKYCDNILCETQHIFVAVRNTVILYLSAIVTGVLACSLELKESLMALNTNLVTTHTCKPTDKPQRHKL